MAIWTVEIKDIERVNESLKGHFPELEKEVGPLLKTDDANVIMLYSRRCLEVIITDLCECELKRPRKTEPLKGIIDKLRKEDKVPSHIISSMHGLNELSTYGAHPKDFDPEQVKPVLVNLDIIIKWYLKYKDFHVEGKQRQAEVKSETEQQTISPPEKSIIVLPFENISPDADQEYFSDGMTEEIITDLSHIHDLLVISRNSAMTFKGTKKKTGEIAKEVNVHYVLEGSVRKSGNNLRITAQLIDALTDTHLWAEKYSGTLDDIFEIQEKTSRSIALSLKLMLGTEEKAKILTKFSENSMLFECFLKAKHEIYGSTKESMDRAVHILQNGLEVFRDNALLLSTLGEAKYMYYEIGADLSERNLNEVEDLAKQVLLMEPDFAYGYKLYGMLERGRGSLLEAYKHMKRAHDLDPNDPWILSYFLILRGMYLGKYCDIDQLHRRLFEIDPLGSSNYIVVASNKYTQGKFSNAVELLRKGIQLYPEFPYNHFWLVTFLASNNQKDEAIEMADQINRDVRIPLVLKELTRFFKFALCGEKESALTALSEGTKLYSWKDPDLSGLMPGYYSLIDEKEEALKYLNHAINRGFINYPFFSKIDPFLENIRSEERFKKLMERVKHEWENFEV
jgi:non-specific serine/threonine protein kinase